MALEGAERCGRIRRVRGDRSGVGLGQDGAERPVDAGEVDLFGSSVLPKMRMFFAGAGSTYDTEPRAGAIQLFVGGDRLEIRGGKGDFAFSGTMPAPAAVKVLAPDLTRELHLPLDGDLHVEWVSEHSVSMMLLRRSTLMGRPRRGS